MYYREIGVLIAIPSRVTAGCRKQKQVRCNFLRNGCSPSLMGNSIAFVIPAMLHGIRQLAEVSVMRYKTGVSNDQD